nr:MAG TPA: HNH endonuclease [Caudoviricetes sp.]
MEKAEVGEWVRSLISQNELYRFYTSAEWERLAAKARDQQHNECQRCKANGFYSPCEAVHHIKYVKRRPDLALDIGNLECLCRECHETEHGRNSKPLTPERW